MVSAGAAAVVEEVEAGEEEEALEGEEVVKRRREQEEEGEEAILVACMHVGREMELEMERPTRSDMRRDAVAIADVYVGGACICAYNERRGWLWDKEGWVQRGQRVRGWTDGEGMQRDGRMCECVCVLE